MEQGFFIPGEDTSASNVTRAFRHHLHALGGMARARLAIATSASLDLPEEDGECLAAAIELLHNASLVQDDYQDQSLSRRGRTTAWLEFGGGVALGLTDRLITAASVCLSRTSNLQHFPALISRIHAAVAETIDGQTADLSPKSSVSDWEETILLAAARKSGPLFALALELPLIAADRTQYLFIAHDAAIRFGLGYQICDDLQDIEQDRPSGDHTNLIIALEAGMGTAAARERGISLAADCFADSIEMANRLPGDSGAALRGLAERAETQLGL
jgi:geranylgeranyl pyrophosphate synthase